MKLSAVIPCYNEGPIIAELYRRLTAACTAEAGTDYELVFVNDGSTDDTLPLLYDLADRDPCVVVVNLSRNHGHQLALTAGLTVVRGDFVLVIDADLQDPPELLSPMMRMAEQGADVVYGQRRHRAGESWFKKATAKAFYRLISRLASVEIPVDTGDFRLMRRRVVDVLLRMPEQHRFVRGMVAWAGYRQEPILYDREARFAGNTKYPLRRMVRFALDAITAFSTRPLRLASYLGLVGVVLSMGLAVYSLIGYLAGNTVQGWTSLVTINLVLGSLQLLILGIMGEYVGRIFIEAKNRPLFVIESVRRHEAQASGQGLDAQPGQAQGAVGDLALARPQAGQGKLYPSDASAHR